MSYVLLFAIGNGREKSTDAEIGLVLMRCDGLKTVTGEIMIATVSECVQVVTLTENVVIGVERGIAVISGGNEMTDITQRGYCCMFVWHHSKHFCCVL